MATANRCLRATGTSFLASSRPSQISKPIFRCNPRRPFSISAIRPIRKYTKDHEWIDIAADNKTGVIGISEYAAEALGDVVYVELPEEGREVGQGDAIGAVESVKSAADINAPVACRVTHVNTELEDKPGQISKVPEDDSAGGGWIAKVEIEEAGIKALDGLMDTAAYKAFTQAEGEH